MAQPDPSHSPLGTVNPEQWPDPELGQRVLYYSRISGVVMPAIVTCTVASYNPTVGSGKLKPPEVMHPHLKILSPGAEYDEYAVEPGIKPGCWAPARVV